MLLAVSRKKFTSAGVAVKLKAQPVIGMGQLDATELQAARYQVKVVVILVANRFDTRQKTIQAHQLVCRSFR